jgi:hypothetical protein
MEGSGCGSIYGTIPTCLLELKKFTKRKEKTHKKPPVRIISVLNEIQTGHFLNISHNITTRSNLFNAKLRTYMTHRHQQYSSEHIRKGR